MTQRVRITIEFNNVPDALSSPEVLTPADLDELVEGFDDEDVPMEADLQVKWEFINE